MNYEKPLYPQRQLTREEEAERDALYLELGKAYYEGAFEDPLPQLLPLFDRLTELLKEPEPEQEHLCPSCGAQLEEDDLFCPECGYKLVADVPAPPQPVPQEVRGPRCGNLLGPNAKFCGACGERIR